MYKIEITMINNTSKRNFIILMKLFFDTETTGLIRKYRGKYINPKYFTAYDKSRLIELCYIIQQDSKIIKKNSVLIKNPDIKIENSHIHGITNTMTEQDGVPANDVLEALYEDLHSYPINAIIAHNIEFDLQIIMAECYRLKKIKLVNALLNLSKYDTMRMAKPLRIYAGYPRLINLYCMLYKTNYEQIHRAEDDTILCMKCFNKYLDLFPDLNLNDHLYHLPDYYELE